jgi:hypothetical protein|tara:strand:+ start:212 stop:394 length:183 start_codon:yes stop_codon:yes gene_type:complete
MYNKSMNNKTVKFVFNQTTYWAGTKYQSGQTIEVPEAKAAEWDKLSFGNIYKPRGSKKEK